MTSRISGLAILATLTLAGCGSAPSSDTPEVSRLEAAEDLFDTVGAYSGTRFDAIPTQGKANFSGTAVMLIDPVEARDDDDVNIIGDVSMTARFADRTVTGQITNMQGIIGTGDELPDDADLFDVRGRIDIGDIGSQIGDDPVEPGRQRAPNGFAANYGGRIFTPGSRYDVEGTLEGRFQGTRSGTGGNRIRGLAAADDAGLSVDHSGDDAPVFIGVAAVNDR